MSNSEQEIIAWSYEMRAQHPNQEPADWFHTVKTTDPREAWEDVDSVEFRNVRPLVEADADV